MLCETSLKIYAVVLHRFVNHGKWASRHERSSGLGGGTAGDGARLPRRHRSPATVTLVAVSKTFGAEAIEPVIAAGQRVFGENRVQEAKAKWPPLIARHGTRDPASNCI